MKLAVEQEVLGDYVYTQLRHFFPDLKPEKVVLREAIAVGLERLEFCLSKTRNKYTFRNGDVYFNHQNTDHYSMFLYYVSHAVYRREQDAKLAGGLYALNKALHGLDVFYEVILPDIFYVSHPLGTVLGKAIYGNYFYFGQNCTVGGNLDNEYPVLGEGVAMSGHSAIIGKCRVGSNVWVSYGALVMAEDVPPDSLVFERSPHLVLKPSRRQIKTEVFRQD